jgi:carbamoyl-phosphate synthase large subunit
MFPEVDPLLGPEMRSTGEVLGLADSFGLAFYKAQEAAQQTLPVDGTVLITVSERDRPAVLEVARQFHQLGFKIKATEGTKRFLAEQGIPSERVLKIHEGRPHIVDAIKSREIDLVVNTPSGRLSKHDDSYIRKARAVQGAKLKARRPALASSPILKLQQPSVRGWGHLNPGGHQKLAAAFGLRLPKKFGAD